MKLQVSISSSVAITGSTSNLATMGADPLSAVSLLSASSGYLGYINPSVTYSFLKSNSFPASTSVIADDRDGGICLISGNGVLVPFQVQKVTHKVCVASFLSPVSPSTSDSSLRMGALNSSFYSPLPASSPGRFSLFQDPLECTSIYAPDAVGSYPFPNTSLEIPVADSSYVSDNNIYTISPARSTSVTKIRSSSMIPPGSVSTANSYEQIHVTKEFLSPTGSSGSVLFSNRSMAIPNSPFTLDNHLNSYQNTGSRPIRQTALWISTYEIEYDDSVITNAKFNPIYISYTNSSPSMNYVRMTKPASGSEPSLIINSGVVPHAVGTHPGTSVNMLMNLSSLSQNGLTSTTNTVICTVHDYLNTLITPTLNKQTTLSVQRNSPGDFDYLRFQ